MKKFYEELLEDAAKHYKQTCERFNLPLSDEDLLRRLNSVRDDCIPLDAIEERISEDEIEALRMVIVDENTPTVDKTPMDKVVKFSALLEKIIISGGFDDILSSNHSCKSCGGNCCKSMGCEVFPWDFDCEITLENMRKVISSGMYSIDFWEGETEVYFIRMRHIGADVSDPAWKGTCIALTENGCSLSFKERPSGGKFLVSMKGMSTHCGKIADKRECAICWIPYQDVLRKLYFEFEDKEIPIPEMGEERERK